jgi:hypothetical protein
MHFLFVEDLKVRKIDVFQSCIDFPIEYIAGIVVYRVIKILGC